MNDFNVAYCGLYCYNCSKLRRDKCPGCQENEQAEWCEIRRCCIENGYTTCADCRITVPAECKKYNNVIAKVIRFVTRTDRSLCLERIKEVGIAEFAREMSVSGLISMKKR